MATRSVVITETEHGWQVTSETKTSQDVATAVEAIALVKQADAALVESGAAKSVVTFITWEPRTRVGEIVACAIAGGDQ